MEKNYSYNVLIFNASFVDCKHGKYTAGINN